MNKYQEALNRMEEAYYSSDNSMGAMSRFKEDVNLLYGLINEHFKEKKETNLEHYYDDLLRVGSHFTFMYGKIRHCWNLDCRKCPFDKGECDERRFKWLLSPYEKTYKEKENE